MKMTITDGFSEESQVYEVTLGSGLPDAQFKEVSDILNRYIKCTGAIQAEPVNAQEIARMLVGFLFFDGKRLTVNQLWGVINGEYYTLFSLADWLVHQAELRAEQQRQKPDHLPGPADTTSGQ